MSITREQARSIYAKLFEVWCREHGVTGEIVEDGEIDEKTETGTVRQN